MISPVSWLQWLPSMIVGLLSLAFLYGLANTTDLLLTGSFVLFENQSAIVHFLRLHENMVWTLSGVISGSAALYYLSRILLKQTPLIAESDAVDVKPLFFPCGTTHTRLFPKKHSFSYSYLLAGFQVGWEGSVGGLLSVDPQNFQGLENTTKDWFVVDAGDYLDRGYAKLGLQGKLRRYLQSQDVDPSSYPYAYLVTVPKLLGYSFNPVSFWYLYSAQKELSAMVLEVNNTFDERRPYFLKAASDQDLSQEDLPNINGVSRKPMRFANTWSKDFHVSPFNSQKGAYSLIAYDPLYPQMTGRGSIDNTITLLSSKNHPKLVARVFSEGDSVNPSHMGFIRRMKFLSSWWWVVYATAIRTIKEAVILYFSHKLHFWLRPEVLKSSIGRKADTSEKELEVVFRKYLGHLVENSEANLQVIYTTAGIPNAVSETFSSASVQLKSAEQLEFKVLTPLFYTRFIHYAHDFEALFSEFAESGTIWLSNPPLLKTLLSKSSLKLNATAAPPPSSSKINSFCFGIIQYLRQRPEVLSTSHPGTKAEETSTTTPITTKKTTSKDDTRKLPLSGMDKFILTKGIEDQQRTYIWLILKIFMAEYIALGSVDILGLELFVVRCVRAWVIAQLLSVKVSSVTMSKPASL